MALKKVFPAIALLLLLTSFCACNNNTNTIAVQPENMRIPVSVNDSVILSIDKSPMDMSYYPEEYPKQKMITPDMSDPIARIVYSRPQKNGRIIFADTTVKQNVIQRYGQDWRLGANEATEIEFFKQVVVGEKKIGPGRYIMYCVPYPDKWKIIFNTNLYSWGLHLDKTKDIAEVEIPVTKNGVEIEYFTMLFQKANYGCDLVMAWGNLKTVLPINFN